MDDDNFFFVGFFITFIIILLLTLTFIAGRMSKDEYKNCTINIIEAKESEWQITYVPMQTKHTQIQIPKTRYI